MKFSQRFRKKKKKKEETILYHILNGLRGKKKLQIRKIIKRDIWNKRRK